MSSGVMSEGFGSVEWPESRNVTYGGIRNKGTVLNCPNIYIFGNDNALNLKNSVEVFIKANSSILSLTGCTKVNIAGLGNKITAEGGREIDMNGDNNQFKSGLDSNCKFSGNDSNVESRSNSNLLFKIREVKVIAEENLNTTLNGLGGTVEIKNTKNHDLFTTNLGSPISKLEVTTGDMMTTEAPGYMKFCNNPNLCCTGTNDDHFSKFHEKGKTEGHMNKFHVKNKYWWDRPGDIQSDKWGNGKHGYARDFTRDCRGRNIPVEPKRSVGCSSLDPRIRIDYVQKLNINSEKYQVDDIEFVMKQLSSKTYDITFQRQGLSSSGVNPTQGNQQIVTMTQGDGKSTSVFALQARKITDLSQGGIHAFRLEANL